MVSAVRLPINIKFHDTAFRKAAELVGLDPGDCFALATYKIYQGLQKQEKEVLPYLFAVVGVSGLTGARVGEARPPGERPDLSRERSPSKHRRAIDPIDPQLATAAEPLAATELAPSGECFADARRTHKSRDLTPSQTQIQRPDPQSNGPPLSSRAPQVSRYKHRYSSLIPHHHRLETYLPFGVIAR